jgi:hypothetical protein
MSLPHLNKDLAQAALLRSGITYEAANKRAFEIVYGTARSWLNASMSLVMDMTMYPDYSPREVGSLLAHGMIVNVHCHAVEALHRWETKMRAMHRQEAEAIIVRGPAIMDLATDPLDLGCERIDVDTTDGYRPSLDDLVARLETLHRGSTERAP